MSIIAPSNSVGSVQHNPTTKGFYLKGEDANAPANNTAYLRNGVTPGWFGGTVAGAIAKAWLEALAGANRLDASAIKNLPAGGGSPIKTTLTAGSTTMVIWHFGTAPTLGSASAGVFTLTIPSGCVASGFDWSGNNASANGSGDMQLTIVSADANNLFYVPAIINKGNNQIANLASLGISIEQSNGTAGTVVATTTSISGFGSSGFLYMGRFA